MPAKTCAACTKSVFPMEELKCLDKTWHKACFKCQVCNMTLNMKNYKGYDKLPYCNAHYPETKFTAVADTPEAKRLAQNSKIQSNIKYHAEYEKERGQYTAVADDPETLRVKKNMETISNVSYHGDLVKRQEMENTRPNEYEPRDSHVAPPTSYTAPPTSYTAPQPQRTSSTSSQGYSSQRPMAPPAQPAYGARRPGSINDYDPMSGSGHVNSPYSNKPQSTTAYSSQNNPQAYGGRLPSSSGPEPSNTYNQRSGGQPPQSAYSYGQPPPQPYSPQSSGQHQQQMYRPPNTSAMVPPQAQQPMRPPQQQQPPPSRAMAPPPQQRLPQQPPRDPYYGKGKVSKSLYDYAAADDDEVSFREDDLIINCEPIDEGWMTGRVERTGQHGMLPSNYVEPLNW